MDFYCGELHLVVELEGGVHDLPEQQERDQFRFDELKARGLRVLRIKNEEVFEDIESVLRKILRFQ